MSKREVRRNKLEKETIRIRLLNSLISDDREKSARQLLKRVRIKYQARGVE